MAIVSNYALRQAAACGQAVAVVLTTAGRDMAYGALSTGRLLVMVVGCTALLSAGVLLSSEDARSLAARLAEPNTAVVSSAEADRSVGSGYEPTRPAADEPQQKRVAQYLARRYRVADGAVRSLVATAFQIGREKNLDPLLILAVVAIESSLNPFAESAMGAQGLMQVMTRVHAQRFEPHGGEMAALDPIANMKVGSSILHELISRGGSVERGLQLYVGAGNMPDDGGYGARVLGERTRLQMAATGKVEAAIAAGIRAAAPPSAVESKPVAYPANADAAVPFEKTDLSAPQSTTDAHQVSAQPEHAV